MGRLRENKTPFCSIMEPMLKTLESGTIAKLLEGTVGEARGLEFKTGFSWELNGSAVTFAQACTIRAVLGLTNTRYGGNIILGIGDDGHSHFTYDGLADDMVASFQDYEQIQQQLDAFADGPMIYEMGVGEYDSKKYIVISVGEFAELPVLCTKDLKTDQGKQVLTKGDMYVRSKRSKSSTIKATGLELREIIRMAHEKDQDAIMELVRSLQQTAPADSQAPASEPYDELDKDL
jgi:predicted HTH transcriptional regulator